MHLKRSFFKLSLGAIGLIGLSSPGFSQNAINADFKGDIQVNGTKSTPDWPKIKQAPQGAPNIAIILLDDVGFAATSTFGGGTQTPEIDKLAQEGLRYNRFHTTALSSPTRSVLLTGRNHHQNGFGVVADLSAGYPGYNAYWSPENASVAQVLKQGGYSTAAFGKWHNTPVNEINAVGPFERWPTSLGFEYYYGFMAGANSQWEPRLFRNTTAVEPTKTVAQGYHLTTDLVDDATQWIHTHNSIAPNKPYFLYFATGATHEPHHVPEAWIQKYKGQFDQGWDKLREEVFARQKKLGVIPANAELTPRPAELPAWESLSADQKKVYAHQMEVYSAFLAHTDAEVGRLVKQIRSAPGGENTAIFYIVGDNGGSAEGGLEGTENSSVNHALGIPDSLSTLLRHINEAGSPKHDNHYAAPWAWATTTPFQWTKQVASHLGGVRNPLIVSWPAQIKAHGEIRSQFSHLNDIAPTLYEITGIPLPQTVNGVIQNPLEGKSLVASFQNAQAPETHTQQYFEMLGNRGIYKDGWWAGSRNGLPWDGKSKVEVEKTSWELYNLNEDFSQAHNLAKQNPEKLAELVKLFDSEAKRNQVYPILPIEGKSQDRFANSTRPSYAKGRTHFEYYAGTTRLPPNAVPDLRRNHKITVQLSELSNKSEGVILAQGGRAGGFSLYIKKGQIVYEHNYIGSEVQKISSPLPKNKKSLQVTFEFTKENEGLLGGGTGVLSIDQNKVGEQKFKHFGGFARRETFDVGADLGSSVSPAYAVPSVFNASLDKVTIDILTTDKK